MHEAGTAMQIKSLCSLLILVSLQALAQGTVPTFTHTVGANTYTLAGSDPSKSTTATIPTVIVPIALSFEARKVVMDAASDVPHIIASPVFARFPYGHIKATQYADALLRATFPNAKNWHTFLGRPEVKPIKITIPAGNGYVLTSKKEGTSAAVVDIELLQTELFKQLPKQDGKLVIAITPNTAFYAMGDATICCSWRTHGVHRATGNSFVLASYLHNAPSVVTDKDIQPLTQQIAEFVNDPLFDPLAAHELYDKHQPASSAPGNPVNWMQPMEGGRCGGVRVGSTYFQLQPTDTNAKNNFPASKPFIATEKGTTWHLQNVALLPWYLSASGANTGTDGLSATYSFPDSSALAEPAKPCPARNAGFTASPQPTAEPIALTQSPNGHKLIGYWSGYGAAGSTFPLRDVSPQWDYILVAFATPDHNAPEGTMQFHTPRGLDTDAFKADITYLKSKGKKVMISLGGGGQHFTLADPNRVPNYVSSVTKIVEDYGFDGIDIDFESPSLSIDPGDTDYRRPTTPSIVNLISALRELRDRFGPGFMISLVPEGTQIPSGLPSYGGQFGSYLPIVHALRDILSFMDVQDYNTPPLQGLDGEIYQPGTVDYHAAMTELVLHGFNVGGDPKQFFPPIPADKVAVGFLTGDTTPD